jgi:hypothetical protein
MYGEEMDRANQLKGLIGVGARDKTQVANPAPVRVAAAEERSPGEILEQLQILIGTINRLESMSEELMNRTMPVRSSGQAQEDTGGLSRPCSTDFGGTLNVQSVRIDNVNDRFRYLLQTLELP